LRVGFQKITTKSSVLTGTSNFGKFRASPQKWGFPIESLATITTGQFEPKELQNMRITECNEDARDYLHERHVYDKFLVAMHHFSYTFPESNFQILKLRDPDPGEPTILVTALNTRKGFDVLDSMIGRFSVFSEIEDVVSFTI
jgi:hypothetical protein